MATQCLGFEGQKQGEGRHSRDKAPWIQIHEKLKEALICVNEEAKLYTFKDGFSDFTVAEAVGASPNAVKLARVELFGKIRHQTNSETIEMRELIANVADLSQRFEKLLLELTLNKIANVKHLVKPK